MQKFFDMESCKKRVISSEQSETGDEPKTQKEGSRNKSETINLDNVFAKDLKNCDFIMTLLAFLRSLEQQVKETSDLAENSIEIQIKVNYFYKKLTKQYYLLVKGLIHISKKEEKFLKK